MLRYVRLLEPCIHVKAFYPKLKYSNLRYITHRLSAKSIKRIEVFNGL